MKNNILGNIELLESLSILDKQKQMTHPLEMASKEINIFNVTQVDNVTARSALTSVKAACSENITSICQFNDRNKSVEYAVKNITALDGVIETPFRDFVRPLFYFSNLNSADDAVRDIVPTILDRRPTVDPFGLQQKSPWLTEVSKYADIETSVLTGINTGFSKLIKQEKETSGLSMIVEHFPAITSAAAQVASIKESVSSITEKWREMIAPAKFLDDYSSFASRQYMLIQKAAHANNDKTVAWRMDLLGVTSKFVDRQIIWANEFAADIQEDFDIDDEDFSDLETELDIATIPQYIGYSKRDDKSVEEAFLSSAITVITEKGKLIVNKARLIQKLCKVNNSEILFNNTDFYIGYYMVIAGTLCQNADSLEHVVESLYHLFYVQRNSISVLINPDDYECMEQIRYLKDNRNYPSRQKEISCLQNKLYDQFLKLEDDIIEKLSADASSDKSAVSVDTMLSEDNWTEKTMSKNILKALLKVQGNGIFWGKTEDELNDGVRDALSMLYEIKDQTRQGASPAGKNAGEVDLQICKDGLPIAMIECLKVDSINRNYLKKHIDKVLTSYDPIGCPYIYVIIYVTAQNFTEYWNKCLKFIKEEYSFPYKVKEEIQEMPHIYTDSGHAKTILLRNDKDVAVHFYALSVQ